MHGLQAQRRLPAQRRLQPQRRRVPTLGSASVVVALGWAIVPVVLLALHVIRHGGVLSGSEGPAPGADQLHIMDDIRQSGEHVLIANHFDLALGHRVFLHPMYLLAGALWRLGLPLQAAFWALKLLAAPALALGALALIRRCLPTTRERVAAVALSLFYMSPIVPLLVWTGAVTGWQRFELELPAAESMPGWLLWGGSHGGVAIGLLALALGGAASVVSAGRTSRARLGGIAAAAALVAWLHPWQGVTFLIVIGALAATTRSKRLAGLLAVPALAAVAPLIYYAVLVRTDAAWRVNSIQIGGAHVPAWMLIAVLLPLAVPAVVGARRASPGPLRTVLVVWPLAALAVYFAGSQFPYHAFNGITVPLAVLAVTGWRKLSSAPWMAAAAVAATIVPGAALELTTWRDSVRSHTAPYWLTAGEHSALRYLEHASASGGVLTRYYLGMAVPAFTGRRTWVGDVFWTPDFARRAAQSERLLRSQMSPAQARRFVRSVGARFLLSDCQTTGDVSRLLGPLVASERRFGCAAVYELRLRPAGVGGA
jgi:hypothetical protein